MNPDKALSLLEALNALYPWIGAGGITAMVVAYLGYRKRPEAPKPAEVQNNMIGLSLLADRMSIQRFADALERHADVIERAGENICNSLEDHKNEMREARFARHSRQ